MRFLLILMAVLAGLYGGYWFVGRSVVVTGIDGLVADLEQSGWEIEYSDRSTGGFPARFDTTITDLNVRQPEQGIGVSIPHFRLVALSYRPTEVIAIWPEEQIVTLPSDRLTVTSQGLRASAAIAPRLAAPLQSVTMESGPMTVLSERGWLVTLDRLLFGFRDAATGPADYDVFLEAETMTPPAELTALIDAGASLPAAIDLVRVDARVSLNQPLDRHLRDGVRPTLISLREAQLTWGSISLTGSGTLTIADDGTADGEILLSAQNWRQVIALAVAAGAVPQGVGRLAERAGAMLSGGSETLSAPLVFAGGNMSLGPIPLGAAPRFR